MQAAREHRSRPPATAMASASVDEEPGDTTLGQQLNATQAATANGKGADSTVNSYLVLSIRF